MKKIVSITLALMLVFAMGMTAFAAKSTGYTRNELTDLVRGSGLAHTEDAAQFVTAMTEDQASKVDVKALKGIVDGLIAKAGAGTITVGDIVGAEASFNGALGGFKIQLSDVSIDAATGNAKATVSSTNGRYPVSVTAANAVNMKTTGSASAAANGGGTVARASVIKATGLDMTTAAVLFALAVMGVLGCAVVKTRKASARA